MNAVIVPKECHNKGANSSKSYLFWKKGKHSQIIHFICFPFPEEGIFPGLDPLSWHSFDIIYTSCLHVFLKVFHYNCRFYSSLKSKSIGKLTNKFLESNYERSMRRYSIHLTLYSDAMNFRKI